MLASGSAVSAQQAAQAPPVAAIDSAATVAPAMSLRDSAIAADSVARSVRHAALRSAVDSLYKRRQYRDALTLYLSEIFALDAALDSAARVPVESVFVQPTILETLASPNPSPPPSPQRIPRELGFIGLLFALFLLPKALQRYRIPGAITSLIMGIAATQLGWFPHDPTIALLSTLGIVALFLFAGLEIDGKELRQNVRPLVFHAAIWSALAIITMLGVVMIFGLSLRVSALLSLALVTPSTGFILSSLRSFGLSDAEQRAVRTYAIGSELIALGALFFVLQSTSVERLLLAIAEMILVVVLIPIAFRAFATIVAPYAPKSEFAFLLMVAIICAYATRLLGVYYLVGAFLVGVAAQRFRANHPAMSSEKMVDALESFGSVFIPFYFFHAGMEIHSDQLSLKAAAIGLLLVALLVPLRVALISLHRRLALGEKFVVSRRVGSAMIPTLVFTLVIVGILNDQFGLSSDIAGALVLYTILNTTMPAFVLRAQPADFEDVEALPVSVVAD
jgi:Kef-type K+ transport system membrane component KefB